MLNPLLCALSLSFSAPLRETRFFTQRRKVKTARRKGVESNYSLSFRLLNEYEREGEKHSDG